MVGTDLAAPQAGSTVARDSWLPGRDARWWFRALAWGLVVVLTLWTASILFIPAIRFNVRIPSARLPLEAVTLTTAVFASVFAYLRYSVGGHRSLLFISLAFLSLAEYHVLSELLIPAGTGTNALRLYTWTAGRFVMAGLLLAGSIGRNLRRRSSERPLHDFALGAVAVTGLLVGLEVMIHLARADLPALATPTGLVSVTGALPGLSPFDISLGLVGTALFLLAAYRYERVGHAWQDTFGLVLAPALVIAAFSHLHYMLEPTVFSDRVSSGEILRLAFALTIVAGLVWEVRPAYLIERSRSRALEAAYLAERERAAELEAADRARAEMLSLLAHELLHPVVAIRATVLAMLKQEDKMDGADRERLLHSLETQTLELKHLTDQIASDARTGERPFELIQRRRKVGETIDELVSALGPIDRRLAFTIDADRSLAVEVDVPRLIQVMRNLVSNAAKFSPDREPIEVDVRASQEDLIVSVIDGGPGLRTGEEELVFRPFFRSPEARLAAVPGSGLGLYVVRGIVAAHGGRIWWQRTAEGRSAFRFTVPLADGNGRIDPWPAS